MFKLFRILILFSIFVIALGCGVKQTMSEYISGKDNAIPPSSLVNFIETTDLNRVWTQDIGKGADDLFTKIRPNILDDQIFIADTRGNVSALTADTGKFIWRNDSDLSITGGPGVGNSLVLVGTSEGEILGLSKETGDEAWRTRVSSEVLSSPEEANSVVIARTIDGKIFAIDANNGKHLWVYDRGVPALSLRGTSTPVIADGFVITGFDEGRVVVIELKTGKLVWEKKVALSRGKNELERMVDIDAQPLVIDKTIYVTTFQANISALALETGQILWQREISSHSELSADEKNIFLTDENGIVWALNRFTGSSIWKQEKLAYRKITGPANFDNKVVVGDFDGYTHWLDKETGNFSARTRMDDEAILTQPISTNEMVFIYSSSGKLSAYTFQDNENKYLTKKLDATNTEAEKIVPSEKSSEKRNAYERSRKRVNTEKPQKETEQKSIFKRFLNIFSVDSEEEVE
ncbi:MAG: outer membrane protein assembly factor BamB [Pseudomonadota bacterium]|nr:outer membrane protein assembly factor BamB [Pseudomonadota bacterium]